MCKRRYPHLILLILFDSIKCSTPSVTWISRPSIDLGLGSLEDNYRVYEIDNEHGRKGWFSLELAW